MARLIDANEITNWLAKYNKMDEFFVGYIETLVETIPTVDAVEVVRCKNCSHNEGSYNEPWCRIYECRKSKDGFCEEGEERR